jgi:predicted P-loop ATPase
VKFRPPYGKTMEERQRFASFIATTNNRRPLVDPTGSRRFICVYAEEIDNTGTINYGQLYAQLYAELQQGRRYWMDDEDNLRIIGQNDQFQRVSSYEEMIRRTYLPSDETPANAKVVLVQDIMSLLAERFPTFAITKGTDMELGRRLVRMGYKKVRRAKGSAFVIQEMPSD